MMPPHVASLPLRPTSALYWLPRIQNEPQLRSIVPRTFVVPYDHVAAVIAQCGEGAYEPDWALILRHVTELGGTAFLRTDQGSAKHEGPFAYKVTNLESLQRAFWLLVEDQEMKFGFEPDATPGALLVREWLDLPAAFTAFGSLGIKDSPGHPIACETRAFVHQDGTVHFHDYWAPGAFETEAELGNLPGDWDELLRAQRDSVTDAEREAMRVAALAFMRACPHEASWSVDFARDRNRKTWLIDAAAGKRSWHPEECPEYHKFRTDRRHEA